LLVEPSFALDAPSSKGTKWSASKSPFGDNSPSSLSTFEVLWAAEPSLFRRPLFPSLVPLTDDTGLPVSPACQKKNIEILNEFAGCIFFKKAVNVYT
jgi:hypothetical protein